MLCLAHRGASINTCWMNEWMNTFGPTSDTILFLIWGSSGTEIVSYYPSYDQALSQSLESGYKLHNWSDLRKLAHCILLMFCWSLELSDEPFKFWGHQWLLFPITRNPFLYLLNGFPTTESMSGNWLRGEDLGPEPWSAPTLGACSK